MKNRSFEIAIIIGLIVFSIIIYGMYLVYNLYLESKSYTLFLKPYSVLECKKWDCKNLSNNLDDYNSEDYNVFINGNNYGVNEILYNNVSRKFFVFDKNNESIYKEGSLFGYNGRAKITGVNYTSDEITTEEINYLKQKNRLTFDNMDVLYSEKIILDFDNDGKNETLYQFSSSVDAPDAPIFFDYVLYEDNDRFYKIVEKTSEKDSFEDIGHTSVSNVMDIFDDNKLEFVLYTEYPINGGNCSVIYRLKGKKFVSVNECENS